MTAPQGVERRAIEDRCLHELFARQAERHAERIALVCEGNRLTYGELHERSTRLAHRLVALGAGPEVRIGLLLDPSIDLIVALIAILKSGAAYVPLDPDAPATRTDFIVRDAAMEIVVTGTRHAERLRGRVRVIVAADAPEADAGEAIAPWAPAAPTRLAYVIYTSGSTGEPKGVLIEHRSVVSLMRGTRALFRFDADDVWTLFHSIAFDFSVWEVWGALLHGARLLIVPRAIARVPGDFAALLERERVTILNQTPSAFAELVRVTTGPGLPAPAFRLRYVIFGGEPLHPRMLRPWVERHGDEQPQLVNMYGITETTVHVTWRRITAADVATDGGSRIGMPIPGLAIRLLGDDGQPVATGAVGEICVAGAGVARGYLARPALTAERFVDDATAPAGLRRLYRSGDLARALPDGDLEYLGRADRQVKVRGFRIEPGEIEAVMERHAGIARCAVAARNDATGNARLIAWWIDAPEAVADTSRASLLAHAQASLPHYMVPAAFVRIEALPLTVNGKLDVAALPEPSGERPGLSTAWRAPGDATEIEIARCFAALLGIDDIGVDDDFFALGGHSLLAARLVARLHAATGRRLPPSAVFDAPTIAQLATRLREAPRVDAASRGRPAPRDEEDRDRDGPLSFAQEGLWLLERFPPARSAYLLSQAWHLDGPLDVAVLRRTLDLLVARHDALRTRVVSSAGMPMLRVDPPGPMQLATTDLSTLAPSAMEARLQAIVADEATRPIEDRREWPVRAHLVRLAAERHALVLTVHHMASDGWSQSVLRRDLGRAWAACLAGRENLLPPPAIGFRDHAARERRSLTPADEAALSRWWAARLQGIAPLELPLDRRRPAEPSHHAASVDVRIDCALVATLRSLALRLGATLQMMLLAAFQILLGRLAGQTDLVVGVPAAGRHEADLDDVVGLFVNTLPIRADLDGDPPFPAFLAAVRNASVAALDHGTLPFAGIVRALGIERDASRTPLVQAFFQLMTFDESPPDLAGLRVTAIAEPGLRVRSDLEMSLTLADGAVSGRALFSTDLFAAATMTRVVAQYAALLRSIARTPEARIGDLAAMTDGEPREQRVAYSGAAVRNDARMPVHVRFEGHAAADPLAVALVAGGEALTRGELDRRADRLAGHLARVAGGRCGRVALYLERSPALIVAMLAVLKAGGAYVPLERATPVARLLATLADAQPDLLVCDDAPPAPIAQAVPRVVRIGEADALHGAAIVTARADDPAYVMYTSGSTGRPKGVVVPHRAIARLVHAASPVGIREGERVAQAANAAFDAATFEIWGALANGGTLVFVDQDTLLAPAAFAAALRRNRIDTLFLTTGLFHEIVGQRPDAFGTLGCLLVGGETVDPGRVRRVLDSAPPTRLLHVYGPTENTTFSTVWEVPRDHDGVSPLPLGRPIAGSSCYVLDAAGRLLPTGAIGEICVGGDGLALGYLHCDALTTERFVAHPFEPGARLYRTGDLGRWTPDGCLWFLGRRDRQVKLRGFRIEPAEIEAVLATHAQVAACAVIPVVDEAGDKHLVAWWVGRAGATDAAAGLRAHLEWHLPHYMVPAQFVRLAALPLTANGKLDPSRLPPPGTSRTRATAAAPAGALEAKLAALWATLLELPHVGRDDDFFRLGGWSLLAVRMVARIESELGMRVEVAEVFRHPTVAGLARRLVPADAAPAAGGIVETLRAGGDRPPLWFPPGATGQVNLWPQLLDALPADQPVHVLRALPWPDDRAPDVHDMAAHYARHVDAFQPGGPLCIAGYSFAGLLAFEMARILAARGRDVRFVGIVDTGADAGRDGVPLLPPWRRAALIAANAPRWSASVAATFVGTDGPATIRRWTRHFAERAVSTLTGRRFRGRSDHIFDVSGWTPAMRRQVDGAFASAATYRFRPFPGRIVVFRARTRPLLHALLPDLGWHHFAQQGVRVVDVPGDHRSMQRPPKVKTFARLFAEALDTELALRSRGDGH